MLNCKNYYYYYYYNYKQNKQRVECMIDEQNKYNNYYKYNNYVDESRISR